MGAHAPRLRQAVGDCVQLGREDNDKRGTLGPEVPRVLYMGQCLLCANTRTLRNGAGSV